MAAVVRAVTLPKMEALVVDDVVEGFADRIGGGVLHILDDGFLRVLVSPLEFGGHSHGLLYLEQFAFDRRDGGGGFALRLAFADDFGGSVRADGVVGIVRIPGERVQGRERGDGPAVVQFARHFQRHSTRQYDVAGCQCSHCGSLVLFG